MTTVSIAKQSGIIYFQKPVTAFTEVLMVLFSFDSDYSILYSILVTFVIMTKGWHHLEMR